MPTKKQSPMTPSELLTAAADWIDSHGWTTGRFYEPETLAACAVGAVQFAAANAGYGADWQARRAAIAVAESALAAIAEELNGRPLDAPTAEAQTILWNNTGCIDQGDAVVWCQKASAQLQEHGK